ncbi:MAG: hypothetical protein ABIH87_04485 [bacterium]
MQKFLVPISLVWVFLAVVIGTVLVVSNKPMKVQPVREVLEKTTVYIKDKAEPAEQTEAIKGKVQVEGYGEESIKAKVSVE